MEKRTGDCKKYLIYGLYCPITDNIHYVGKSSNYLLRPLQHFKNSHSELIREWVSELKFLGYTPKIKVLEDFDSGELLAEKEKFWINKFKLENCILLNAYSVNPAKYLADLSPIELRNPQTDMAEISKFVKLSRKSVGLTQVEFAQKAGVALTLVRKIEQGHSNILLDKLHIILNMFGAKLYVKRYIRQQ